MRTIKLQVEDNIYDEILKSGMNIQDELKLALHKLISKKNTYINSEQYKADKKYFNDAPDEIESRDEQVYESTINDNYRSEKYTLARQDIITNDDLIKKITILLKAIKFENAIILRS